MADSRNLSCNTSRATAQRFSLQTTCPTTWLKRPGKNAAGHGAKLLDISDMPVTNIRALSAMMHKKFGKYPHTLTVSAQAYEALQNDAEVHSYLPSFQSAPATHEQLIIILGVKAIVVDDGKSCDVATFEGKPNVTLHCDVQPCASQAAWIKRRARCIGVAYSVARREALEAACQDWLAFNPTVSA